jgi:hypothetical protein
MRRVLATVLLEMRKELLAPELPEDTEVSSRLSDQAFFFIEEMDRSLAGVAFFAANVMGAAALETVLLIACLKHRSRVLATQKWQKIHKNEPPKPFSGGWQETG